MTLTATGAEADAPARPGLPAIEPYPLPAAADLPGNRVAWTLDPARAVLLVHDMQNYFAAPYACGPDGRRLTDHVADRINRLRARAWAVGVPVVFTAQPGDQDPAERALLSDFWGPGLGADGHAPEIVAALAPQPHETVLTKWRYSAFVRTPLGELLAGHGRDQLIVTGIYTHIGCQQTAVDAFMRDIQAFLVADATADFSAADHAQALAYVARRAGVVLTTDDVLDQLGAARLTRDTARRDIATIVDEDPADLTDDVAIIDSGVDSMRVVELVERWNAAGSPVTLDDLLERETIGEWLDAVVGT